MVRQEIRRVLLSPFFYLSIAVLFIGSFFPTLYDISVQYDLSYLMDSSLSGYGRGLIPILSSLAVADSYLVEERSGYRYAVMSRTTKLRYCISKIGVAAGAGICVVLFTKLLLLLSMTISSLCIHGQVVLGGESIQNTCGGMRYWINRRNYVMFIGQNILYDCMYAAVFPGLSLAVSTVIKNKYVVMLFPFIYDNVTAFVFVGLKWYYLTPSVMDAMGRALLLPHEGLTYRIMMVLIYWVVTTVLFTLGVRKEMK